MKAIYLIQTRNL